MRRATLMAVLLTLIGWAGGCQTQVQNSYDADKLKAVLASYETRLRTLEEQQKPLVEVAHIHPGQAAWERRGVADMAAGLAAERRRLAAATQPGRK